MRTTSRVRHAYLDAINDPKPPIVVDFPNVAGVYPTFSVNGFFGISFV
jgi:hypothetical protein